MKEVKTLLETMYRKMRCRIRHRGRHHKHSAMAVTACMLTVAFLCAAGISGESRNLIGRTSGNRAVSGGGMGKVLAAETSQTEELQAGLKGVVHGAFTMTEYSRAAEEIEIAGANEEILVGAARVSRQDVFRDTLEEGTRPAGDVAARARALVRENQMPASEYQTLLQIVEAEATGEDLKGKMLIASVILNRVADERFPNTIEEVVWQEIGGSPQFQPTMDGRIHSVEITDSTIEAVDRVFSGEDYSQGALYFMARNASESDSVGWFDTNLQLLFEHGGHEYYTLSEEAIVS
mgnify:FL=1